MPEEAAKALLFHAARVTDLDDRLTAYRDALRWLPEDHSQRQQVEAQIGLAVLDDAQRRGALTAEEKRRLEEAAAHLEHAERMSEAATAYELLGRTDDVARCLQEAGEVDRLEALLEETTAESRKERRQRRFISNYEMAMKVGARLEARRALQAAREDAPSDQGIADLLRRLESRLLEGRAVTLSVDGEEVVFVGKAKIALGRDADVVVRGASVSRRHTELVPQDGRVLVRDLDSRNGTLVRGVPIAGELTIDGPTDIGLGDDGAVRITPVSTGLRLEVLEGLDRGRIAYVGEGALRHEGLSGTITFPTGQPTLTLDAGCVVELGQQSVAAPVELLQQDVLRVDGRRVEVL